MFSEIDQAEQPQERSPGSRPTRRRLAASRERIARRAYQIWESHGCPCGTEAQDWLQAEAELKTAQFFRAGRLETRRRRCGAAARAAGKSPPPPRGEKYDIIDEASIESFPASDSPAWVYGMCHAPGKPR